MKQRMEQPTATIGQTKNAADQDFAGLLRDYATQIAATDRLPADQIRPVLFGLFGEVGSLLAASKKRRREQAAFPHYEQALHEELGDILWYVCALSRRVGLNVSVPVRFAGACESPNCAEEEESLAALGVAAGELLDTQTGGDWAARIDDFLTSFLTVVEATGSDLEQLVRSNREKVRRRFLPPRIETLPTFDDAFPEDERLPMEFAIEIRQRSSTGVRMRWNGVFIGDTLTDNVLDPDGYRFHDVFHLAYAAILHWSPVVRSLIRQKRKSDRRIDENEDGGRAIAVEEGLTVWLFSQAKRVGYFSGSDGVSFGTLKTIQQFVEDFEVAKCPLSLWERAILAGYAVFRKVREESGGVVIGDRRKRTIRFEPG